MISAQAITPFALIALFGWIPCVMCFFVFMPARKATATAIVGAWLLLPPISLEIAGLPDYSKSTAATIGIVLGTVLFGSHLLLKFRFRWFDGVMLLFCLTGIGSSLQNGLGLYDGLSDAFANCITWGVPYLLGRLYFNDLEGLRTFTIAMVIGGLSYVLPCLWEIRMSPHLMRNIYGVGGWQGLRLGGFRPNVFFKTGLELGLWMTAASLTAWWLWRCGTLKKIGPVRFGSILLLILVGTTVLCRSTGALILLAGGMFILWASTRFQTRMLLWALVLIFPLYAAVRIPNFWAGEQLVELTKTGIGPERAESLEYRFKCENLLIAKAVQRPVWGWAGWNRSAVYFTDDPRFQDSFHQVPFDGVWTATLSGKGFVGLILWYIVMELPVMIFLARFPARLWRHPEVAPAAVVATLLGLYMIDCILNGFINIIYISLAGGLISLKPTQIATGPAGLYGTQDTAPRAGRLDRNAVGVNTQFHTITSTQPNHVLPRSVVTAMGLADRYRELGRSLKSDGRWADAYSAWKKSLDVLTELTGRHADIPELQRCWCDCGNDLAWLLLTYPESDSRRLTDALKLAMQVADRCPEVDVYWNTLGMAYLRNGEPKAAVTAIDRALALGNGVNPFNHVLLAMAHAQLGDREQARYWLAEATLVKDREYQNHRELAGFCDEARAVVGADPEAPSTVI
jgi:tetratricopeptide (TPR) repeat protein